MANIMEIEGLDFSGDLKAFDDHLSKNEELYEEVHGVFKRMTDKGSGVMGMSHTRDIAEVGKTLSSIRSTSLSAVNQRFAARKGVAELKMKEKQIENGKRDNEDSIQVARSLLREITEERISSSRARIQENGNGSIIPDNQITSNKKGKEQLRNRIQEDVSNGVIKPTANEKAMKYDFKGVVKYMYDTKGDKVVAVDKTTNCQIDDYPAERIPRMKVIRVEGDKAVMNNGSLIEVLGD